MESLNQKLAALRAEKDAARDPAITAILQRSTQALRSSTILAGVKQVGQRAPLFSRPGLDGRTLRLTTMLQSGPVVLSFFRGRW